jgi:enterochelin esterase-like enzyme
VLEPQGTFFLFLLILTFGGLVTWIALARHVAIRVLAAFLAFLPAAVFGIAVVNIYYDYYQTWGSLFSDVTGSGAQAVPELAQPGNQVQPGTLGVAIDKSAGTAVSARVGYLFRASVPGRTSHLTRDVYVYLPPQYFQPAYRHYRFPAIELLHGSPGSPLAFINVLDTIPIFQSLLADREAAPAVLVMPETDGGARYSLQCLNIPPRGPMDMTFLASEVPDWATRNLRVMPPGPAWGVGGYSEGGFCAANIGLQDHQRFGFAAIMSGYFAPDAGHVPAGGRPGAPPVLEKNVFAGYPRLQALNTPQEYIQRFPIGQYPPGIWLAVGGSDRADLQAARDFQQFAMLRITNVPLMVVKGGGHQAAVWRAAMPALLRWMTPQLAAADRRVEMLAARHHATVSPKVTASPKGTGPHKGSPARKGTIALPTGQPTRA